MYLCLSTVWLLSFQLLAGLVLICWPNKPYIFHEAVRLGNENTQTLINWLIEWIRLNTALEISDAPFPLPFSPLPCALPCHGFHAWRRQAAGGSWGTPSSLLKAGPFQGTCWCLLHPQSPRGKVWALSKFTTNPTSGSLNSRQTHHFQAWIPGHVKWL